MYFTEQFIADTRKLDKTGRAAVILGVMLREFGLGKKLVMESAPEQFASMYPVENRIIGEFFTRVSA